MPKAVKLSKGRRNGRIADTKTEVQQDFKLDLGGGRNPAPGFINVDLYSPEADVKFDLRKRPWPWPDNSVSEVHCSHFLEHLDQDVRWPFFEELWRVMKMDAIARFFCPSWKSERSLGDLTHRFPPVTSFSFLYLNKKWRDDNKLNYGPYDLKCNFDHQSGPLGLMPDVASRSDEVKLMMCTRQLETYSDLWVVLTKRPMDQPTV